MFERIRQLELTRRLALGLALVLFAQLLIPLQAHSRIARDAHGLTVVVCTLQGPRDMALDAQGRPVSGHPHASAAMAFSQLLNNVSPLLAPLPVPRRVLAWNLAARETPAPGLHSEQPAPSSRDPPLV